MNADPSITHLTLNGTLYAVETNTLIAALLCCGMDSNILPTHPVNNRVNRRRPDSKLQSQSFLGCLPGRVPLPYFKAIANAVNQGIDSHLQAIHFAQSRGEHGRTRFTFEPASMAVLVRRLMESGNERAESLASSICETLDIELI